MPKRGEVWLVDLGLASKARPALVLSKQVSEDNRALITVVPHTQSVRGFRFEIAVPAPFLKSGAFLVQNPITIPASKAERLLGKLTLLQLRQVEEAVRDWLGL